MKNLIDKFKGLTVSKKIQIIAAMIFTIALLVTIPVYAWFTNQKKAAEMFKIEYPNALYINAAHREDQVNFALDGIDVNAYQTDANGDIVEKRETVTDTDGTTKEIKVPVKITEKRYVFSVSGSNTNQFVLQMAHTNNNLFTYKIYAATEQTKEPDSGTYVKYKATGEHTENTMVFTGDTVSKNDTLYYVKGDEVSGRYLNMDSGASVAQSGTSNAEYYKTYGNNTNVESHAVPSYWQATINADQGANKQFCKYFILEVTWDNKVQATQTAKETDLVYFSVTRKS